MMRILPILFLVIFAVLAVFGLAQNKEGRALVATEGRPVPEFSLPAFKTNLPLESADLEKGLVLVNFFASWCLPCVSEHEFLKDVAEKNNLPLVGIAYKDKVSALEKFFTAHGNPYKHLGLDETGRTAIEWGVTGVPETFLLKDGRVVAHVAGPLTDHLWSQRLAPLLP